MSAADAKTAPEKSPDPTTQAEPTRFRVVGRSGPSVARVPGLWIRRARDMRTGGSVDGAPRQITGPFLGCGSEWDAGEYDILEPALVQAEPSGDARRSIRFAVHAAMRIGYDAGESAACNLGGGGGGGGSKHTKTCDALVDAFEAYAATRARDSSEAADRFDELCGVQAHQRRAQEEEATRAPVPPAPSQDAFGLRSCPFCGGTDVRTHTVTEPIRRVAFKCHGCKAIGPRTHLAGVEAQRLWNTREALAALPAVTGDARGAA